MADLNAEMSWAGPLLLNQVLSARYKVCEGVLLVQVLAILVPISAHLTPTPHMGKGKDKAPVYEGQPVGAQIWIIADLIGAIPAARSLS